jgi:asparagine synthase (glutamine-hydrolysing)
MCGIAGIVSRGDRPVQAEELWSMCAAMVHRGPDDAGYYVGAGVGLGMRRLSIIDLETGHQPVRNEDGTVWAVMNGEIYNFPALRRDLEACGHSFATRTDTEVIVHLYERDGADCVRHLRGMFAFALWDTRSRTLMLARDRLGIKPLYYTEQEGRLAFASELKVLLQLPEVERHINWEALGHLFTFQYTPAAESIIEGVHKLEPGHSLILSPDGGLRRHRYWDVHFKPETGRDEGWFVERLRALLEESVRMHLASDVPVGAFLSGGVDSSAVVATMARLSDQPVRTYSIGFHEPEYDESRHARALARRLGTEYRELILEPDITGSLDDIAWHLDEPLGDSSVIPTYMVSKLAAREVTVVLSGDGGDELFAGYDKYRVEERERRRQRWAVPVRPLLRWAAALPEGTKGRNLLQHYGLSGRARYLDAQLAFRPDQQRRLFRPEAAEQLRHQEAWRAADALLGRVRGDDWLGALQYFDLHHYLPLDILTKVDRMSMAHSLEARVPLLDHALVEFAATVPAEYRLRDGRGKYLFKRALRGLLPDEVLERPKRGFALPLGHWFRGGLGPYLRDQLLSPRARARGFFKADYVERLITLHEAGRRLDMKLWTLLSFELWCQTFLDDDRIRISTPSSPCQDMTAVMPGRRAAR